MKLFDILYDGIKDTIKAVNKPLILRDVKRKLEKAKDSAEERRNTAQITINEELEKLKEMDINLVLKSMMDVKDAEEVMANVDLLMHKLFEEEARKDKAK